MRKNYDLMWARQHANLTQKEAAEKAGVSRATFNLWENGAVATPPRKYKRFLDAVDIKQQDIPKNLAPVEPIGTHPSSVEYDDRGYPLGWKYNAFKWLEEVDVELPEDLSSVMAIEDYILELVEGAEYPARDRLRQELLLRRCGLSEDAIAQQLALRG
jgi:DNA-binding XRE family transcriptional regulator